MSTDRIFDSVPYGIIEIFLLSQGTESSRCNTFSVGFRWSVERSVRRVSVRCPASKIDINIFSMSILFLYFHAISAVRPAL